ncbi:MAG: hypothetical protein CAF45_013145 [Nitrospira sp. CG24E]|nr:MAG: hypothetical protein CAF45_013145 [Nitrospira sp. CG24E]
MAQEDNSQRTMTIFKSAAAFGLWGAVAGTLIGALVGAVGGTAYEFITGTAGMNSRSLFLYTAPIGVLLGIGYGIWKEL